MTTENADEEKAEESSGQAVDARLGRALSEFLYAEKGQYGDETYRIHSGSGETYAVDLNGPDGERFCSCPDTAFCKHLLHVLLVESPQTLLEGEHGAENCPGGEGPSVGDGGQIDDTATTDATTVTDGGQDSTVDPDPDADTGTRDSDQATNEGDATHTLYLVIQSRYTDGTYESKVSDCFENKSDANAHALATGRPLASSNDGASHRVERVSTSTTRNEPP
jgi:hypothetical protein